MSVRVHVLGADPRLAPYMSRIDAAVHAAVDRINQHLLISNIDIVVETNPSSVIPEFGIGGFSPIGHAVRVSLDPLHAGFPALLDLHLSRTLAHELHHCARWRGPGYGSTLGEALVSEGLADHFDLQVHHGADPYYWAQGLDGMQLREVAAQASKRLWEMAYDHTYWFFNESLAGPPYHAGYALGFHVIQVFLATNPDHQPSDLVCTPAQEILGHHAVQDWLRNQT